MVLDYKVDRALRVRVSHGWTVLLHSRLKVYQALVGLHWEVSSSHTVRPFDWSMQDMKL